MNTEPPATESVAVERHIHACTAVRSVVTEHSGLIPVAAQCAVLTAPYADETLELQLLTLSGSGCLSGHFCLVHIQGITSWKSEA